MSEIKWTGYGAMQPVVQGTTLQNLVNGSCVLGGAIDLTADPYNSHQYLDLELVLGAVDLSGKVNPSVYVWIIPRTDGVNFEDAAAGTSSTAVIPARPPDVIFPVRAANTAGQRLYQRMALTLPDQVKFFVQNNTGANLTNDTVNTLKARPYGDQIA